MVKYIQYWLVFIHLVFAVDLKTGDVYDVEYYEQAEELRASASSP